MAQVEFEVPGPGTYLIDADPSLPALSNPGQASDVLSGEQFYDEDGNPVTGTMPSNPTEAIVIPGGGSYTIPQGYHTGQGTVTSSGSALPTLTNPAAAGEIASGKEVIDQNGAVMTGTMPSNPAISETLKAGESYQVPAGYTPGGTVQAASLASQTPGTATQGDIIQGQTAWVNGVQITGALEPGSDTSDATATAADILAPQTAYVATGKVEGTMPTRTADDVTIQNTTINVASGYYAPNTTKEIQAVEQATPSISVSAGGLITATSEQTAGFVAEGTKSATQQLPVQGAQTITPGPTQQTINGGVYLTGAQTIQGDANLVPDNIKENVSIFGVTGTYGGGGSTGDFAVPLTVTVDTGATVTAKNGDTTLTSQSVDRQASFVLTSGGVWTITANLNGRVGQSVVTVNSSYATTITLPSSVQVFGVSWDTSSSSTQLTRLTSSTDPNGYVTEDISTAPAPAVGTGAGSSPFDTYLPWSGMEQYNIIDGSISYKQGDLGFSQTNYDTVVYIPIFYYRIEEANGVRYFYVSNGEREGFELHPGSGKYVARYNTSADYYSVSGTVPLTEVGRATVRTQSRAKGAGWDGYDYMTWCAVWLLYLVEFADWNSQAVIGAGITGASAVQNNGGTDSMTYHTGRAAGTDNLSAVQYRNIENPWGNVSEWLDGVNSRYTVASDSTTIYICTTPESYSDSITGDYTSSGVSLPYPRNYWIRSIGLSESFPWAFAPSSGGGSATTYIPDHVVGAASTGAVNVSGYHRGTTSAGLFYFNMNRGYNSTDSSTGARLLFRP